MRVHFDLSEHISQKNEEGNHTNNLVCNISDQRNSISKGADGAYLAFLRNSRRPLWLKMSKPGEMKSERLR